MGILYCARMARFDLLRATCRLACYATKWDMDCDKKLFRLICYIHSTYDKRQVGWIGDPIHQLSPHLYADADFAGCEKSQKSTSGVHLMIEGPNSRFPVTGVSKRQGCVSNSTPEAEMVAGHFGLRTVMMPALDLWENLSPKSPKGTFHEHKQAMIQVCKTGKNPTMRH